MLVKPSSTWFLVWLRGVTHGTHFSAKRKFDGGMEDGRKPTHITLNRSSVNRHVEQLNKRSDVLMLRSVG